MIYVAELMDIKKSRIDLSMCLIKIGETELNCLLSRYGKGIEKDAMVQKIKDFMIGGKYKFDIWIDAANELDTIGEETKKMPIPEDDYLFDYFAGMIVKRLDDNNYDKIPDIRVETENGFLFDVTNPPGWDDLKLMEPGDYVEIYRGGYFIKDIYPLDYEEAGK